MLMIIDYHYVMIVINNGRTALVAINTHNQTFLTSDVKTNTRTPPVVYFNLGS